ncbi:hypothetical protein D9758_001826 [Tetrapyrgos nigripes]|uniref:DNA polymerase kappa n=1 Tax=Tetrapyrgos nigripes TaxID=182062 RepID=A0A8H5LV48_9AGAR|nr:hypothetical protein D9758_001826 [Tetrapyrgos nigripes]
MASQESASLLKRLAGPSSGKAGLAKDQTEINQIIAEASKGSKFYEARHEKRKDKELTERINKLLKAREEALKNVDISKVESNIDRLVAELESQRDLSQIIVHVDMDAFFANVELLFDPSLKGKPFAVGGGVLSTASYEARKYGCRSGMASHIAKKLCPHLILLSSHYDRYSEYSNRIMKIFARYDPNMCPAGTDEAYLNITEYCACNNISAEDCVQEMRKAVFEDTTLTVSAGIAPNKMLAKICSDRNKPNGQFQLEFDARTIIEFMKDLPIRKVPGIGRVSERLLDSIDVRTCGDVFVQRAVISLLDKQFGLGLRSLLQTGLGIASNVVAPYQREDRKSIGVERTFHTISDKEKLFDKLEEIAEELEKDMAESGWAGTTVTLKYKLDTFQVFTRAKSSTRWITKKEDLLAIGKDLLIAELPLSLRLIGLRVTHLKDLKLSESVGIKRFFDSSGNFIKKRKLDHEEERQEEQKETDHWDHEDFNDLAEAEAEMTEPDPHRPRPPTSAPVASSSKVSIRSSEKPRSTIGISSSQQPQESHPEEAGGYECPVCDTKLAEADNEKINAHIDFCLSRSAIQEAQREDTGGSPKPKSKGGWDWFLEEQRTSNKKRKGKKHK